MLAACAIAALGCQFRPELLQPTTYRSPVGEWSLFVDPSSKHGWGPARVVASRSGETVWERKLDVSFWSAAIDDEGRVAGYGFTHGPRSWEGALHVLVLSPTGEVVLDDEHEMRGSAGPDGPNNPQVRGAFLQPELDRYVVRVVDEFEHPRDEAWWSYRSSTGERLDTFHPKRSDRTGALSYSNAACAVPGVPLALVEWRGRGGAPKEVLVRIVLCDAEWRALWSSEQIGRDDARSSPTAILDSTGPGRFALRSFAEGPRIEYEVSADTSDPSGWNVREIDRVALEPPSDRKRVVPPPLPELDLELRSSVLLAATPPEPEGPVRDLLAFTVDAAGRARFVRGEAEEDVVSLVTLDEQGAVVRELRVEPLDPESEAPRSWWALAGDDWLCTLDRGARGDAVHAWRVSNTTGSATPLAAFPAWSVDLVASGPEGGCIVFDEGAERIRSLDASGAERWSREVVRYSEPPDDDVPFPLDLTATPGGGVALLAPDEIRFLDALGEHVRSIDIADLELRLEADFDLLRMESSGTLLVYDDYAERWHRLAPDGSELGRFELRRANGSREVGEPALLRLAADGGLWTTDGRELLAVDPDGIAHPRFGRAADPCALSDPAAIVFDGRGRVAVVDGHTRVVHLFEASGELAFRCVPAPTDFAPDEELDRVKSGPDGRVYVHVHETERWVEFDERGRRIGPSPCKGDDLAFGKDGARWCGGGTVWQDACVQRIEADGSKGPRVDRRPDGDFIEAISGIACTPDGSLVLIEDARPIAIGIYDADGRSEHRIPIARAQRPWPCSLSIGRRWILAGDDSGSALLVSMPGGRAAHFAPVEGDDHDARYAFTLSPDETELWCATTAPLALHRYALPR